MNPLRILHVVPAIRHDGGIEAFIMNVYRNIDREKIQFDFLAHKEKRYDYDYGDEIKSLGGNIYRLSVLDDWNLIKYKHDLKEFFKNNSYLILHGHLMFLGFIYSSIARKAGVKKIIAHSHTDSTVRTLRGFVQYFLRRLWKTNVDVMFACSTAAGKFVFDKSDFVVVKNGINCCDFKFDMSVRQKYRTLLNLHGKKVIGHVGRFAQEKNHIFLIKMFAEYVKLQPNSVLLLVGDGPLRQKINDLVDNNNLQGKVMFLGVRSDVNKLYQVMDLFVLPSLFEGLGIVAIEAQVAGLPLLISDVVPNEARITDLVHLQPLSSGSKAWAVKADEIIGNALERSDTCSQIIAAGFDIKHTAEFFSEYYLSNS